MNWNEWRMRWLFFWLLVAVLAILLVGCSHNPPETIEDPSDYLEKPLDPECDLDDVAYSSPSSRTRLESLSQRY